MKKRFALYVMFAAMALFATACGDDVTEVTEVNEVHQDGMAVLDAGLELSKQKCDTTNVGDMLFVTDSSEVFVCNGKAWVSLKGADGKPGETGPQGLQGETGEKGEPGTDGDDGESCTAKPVKNEAGLEGIEVTCGKTVVGTIWNGADGDDGEGCEISREENVLTIACANSTVTIDLNELVQASSSSEEESSSSSVIASSSSAKQFSSSSEVSSSSEEESSSSEEASSSSEESSSSDVIASSSGAKQSSSSEESSSSAEESSSSEAGAVKPAEYYKDNCPAGHTCKDAAPSTYLKDGIIYGEILDTRDDQVYKTVKICNDDKSSCQTWMAQNLNYAYNQSTSSLDSSSFCYGDDPNNCDTYGRLYLWSAAMDSAAKFSTTGKGCGYYGTTCSASGTIQGVCPEGWHLPSHGEFETLINYFDPYFGYGYTDDASSSTAGPYLKSQSGWYGSGNGYDTYGFSALPAGSWNDFGGFSYEGKDAYFWSSSKYDNYRAYNLLLRYDYNGAGLNKDYMYSARSVRCLKNN